MSLIKANDLSKPTPEPPKAELKADPIKKEASVHISSDSGDSETDVPRQSQSSEKEDTNCLDKYMDKYKKIQKTEPLTYKHNLCLNFDTATEGKRKAKPKKMI